MTLKTQLYFFCHCDKVLNIKEMKIKIKPPQIVFAALGIAVFLTAIIFIARSPVLIISDMVFRDLYGKHRFRIETVKSSIILFRIVKPVMIADDASDDILLAAIESASRRPNCVIFPLRFAMTARSYRENYPKIPVIILEGRYSEDGTNPLSSMIGSSREDYFIYGTDIEADFNRAGLAAAFLDDEKNGTIVVFLESYTQRQGRENFTKILVEMEKTIKTQFFLSYSQQQISRINDISCAVLVGSGGEFLEKHPDIPVILFTWLNPGLFPDNVAVIFDDSPLIQVVFAVRMAAAGLAEGRIPSKMAAVKSGKFNKEMTKKIINFDEKKPLDDLTNF